MDFKPVLLRNEKEMADVAARTHATVHDLVADQLKELFVIRHLHAIKDRASVAGTAEFREFSTSKSATFNRFFFPWLNRIVLTLPEADYFLLRTNRNCDLITEPEQDILKSFTVAVFGLSVGSNIAFLLTQAGISNRMILADPDSLETTNLNRLLTGVQDIGLNKAILASRKICEANPYAQPEPFTGGINDVLLESLLKAGGIHCIVEEVDALPVKISTRKLAMKYKVPVVMVTDNGFSVVLHVERYDLGYGLIFEKDAAYWDQQLAGVLSHEKISKLIIEDIFGSAERIDPRLFASNVRIMKKELVSWPQLGSTAMFGGTVAMQAIKKIALQESDRLFTKKFLSLDL